MTVVTRRLKACSSLPVIVRILDIHARRIIGDPGHPASKILNGDDWRLEASIH